jgi:hypothetical protein
MLFDLKPLDVDVRDDEAHQHSNADKSYPGLHIKTATECVPGDHQRSHKTDRVQEKRKVSDDTMHDDPAVSDKWCELENCEYSSWKNTAEMQKDSDLVPVKVQVVIAFAWCCAVTAL